MNKTLLQDVMDWTEEVIKLTSYSPDMTGEDALKTLATAAGMRAVVTQLAGIYTAQQGKKKKDGDKSTQRSNHDRKRWPPAGTTGGPPKGSPDRGPERGPIVPEA